MNILIIGGGGREHALAWKCHQSRHVKKIYCAPGNGGMHDIAHVVTMDPTDLVSLSQFAQDKKVDLTIVGPELPLALGLVDHFESKGLKAFGPSKKAAQLEASKIYSKQFMQKYKIPTAAFEIFDQAEKAKDYLSRRSYPCVIKADGLAAGKGVIICQNFHTAHQAITDIMEKRIFGTAGDRIIIEDCLVGAETSILAFCDGTTILPMQTSQDHKRAYDDDQGPNTGGMGSYSPTSLVPDALMADIQRYILQPVIDGMRQEGSPYTGILYAGLMLTEDGPKVLEYNVRFGDPEAQVIIPRLKNDLVEIIDACLGGRLSALELAWDDRAAVCVVLASGGYPASYEKGKTILGLDALTAERCTLVFHAGTKRDENNHIVTSGGRVLGITSLQKNLKDARETCYRSVKKIYFDDIFYRNDIGQKAFDKHGNVSVQD